MSAAKGKVANDGLEGRQKNGGECPRKWGETQCLLKVVRETLQREFGDRFSLIPQSPRPAARCLRLSIFASNCFMATHPGTSRLESSPYQPLIGVVHGFGSVFAQARASAGAIRKINNGRTGNSEATSSGDGYAVESSIGGADTDIQTECRTGFSDDMLRTCLAPSCEPMERIDECWKDSMNNPQ